ncbi:HAD family hydrolase [Frondihabitans peucedani]|uniref:Hydrolase of the HAD superfamily n=1 Tax=Frondihabitans peucedani TaxID=598626 RepID=A0ABP8E4G6_9MICO
MAIHAVLFDLYGTLAPGGTAELRDEVSREVARELGVDAVAFSEAVGETFRERTIGSTGSLEETLALLAERLGGSPDAAAVSRAADLRLEMTRALLDATWALDVLDELRARGLPLGLVSDCSSETSLVWPTTALSTRFDAHAFSCAHGIKKPDARLYRVVTGRLGVDPASCLYVGDGGSSELAGATELGMRAVWLDHPGNQGGTHGVFWPGERAGELHEILGLLSPAEAR